jgi:hypothetical protein
VNEHFALLSLFKQDGVVRGSLYCQSTQKLSLDNIASIVHWEAPKLETPLNNMLFDIITSDAASLESRIKSLSAEEFKAVVLDNPYNTSVLFKACIEHSTVSVLQCLLDHECSNNTVYPPTGDTALHMACKKNDFNFVSLLVERGASVDILNGENKKPGEYVTSKELEENFTWIEKQKSQAIPSPEVVNWWRELKSKSFHQQCLHSNCTILVEEKVVRFLGLVIALTT